MSGLFWSLIMLATICRLPVFISKNQTFPCPSYWVQVIYCSSTRGSQSKTESNVICSSIPGACAISSSAEKLTTGSKSTISSSARQGTSRRSIRTIINSDAIFMVFPLKNGDVFSLYTDRGEISLFTHVYPVSISGIQNIDITLRHVHDGALVSLNRGVKANYIDPLVPD